MSLNLSCNYEWSKEISAILKSWWCLSKIVGLGTKSRKLFPIYQSTLTMFGKNRVRLWQNDEKSKSVLIFCLESVLTHQPKTLLSTDQGETPHILHFAPKIISSDTDSGILFTFSYSFFLILTLHITVGTVLQGSRCAAALLYGMRRKDCIPLWKWNRLSEKHAVYLLMFELLYGGCIWERVQYSDSKDHAGLCLLFRLLYISGLWHLY